MLSLTLSINNCATKADLYNELNRIKSLIALDLGSAMEKDMHYELHGADEEEIAQEKQYKRYNVLRRLNRTDEEEKEFQELFTILSPYWEKK